jgi:hypothetical protein
MDWRRTSSLRFNSAAHPCVKLALQFNFVAGIKYYQYNVCTKYVVLASVLFVSILNMDALLLVPF